MTDFGLYLRVFFALLAVLALIGIVAFLLRRFGADRFKVARGQRRLSIVEVATIDTRRRLILVRRDTVEHLVLIGGPNDLVIEARLSPQGGSAAEFSEIQSSSEAPSARRMPTFAGPTFTGPS